MAIDQGKLQEDEATAVTRFYNIILGWDYKQLTKENEVNSYSSSVEFVNFVFFFHLSNSVLIFNTEEK